MLSALSVNAKGGHKAPAATKPIAQPIAQPIVTPRILQQPMAKPTSYAQALNAIKTKMSSNEILVNNTFTKKFIDFVQSLNLSPIETKALLEAGAHIHATWTDNNKINNQTLLSLNNTIQNIMRIKPTEPKQSSATKSIEKLPPVTIPKPVVSAEKIIPITPTKPIEQIKPTIPAKPIATIQPILPTAPVAQPAPIITKDKTHQDLLGKVKKLEGYDIYVGYGISPSAEQIFFGMEKLDNKNYPVWDKYMKALLDHKQVINSLRVLNTTCNDQKYLSQQEKSPSTNLFRLDDPYITQLLEKMCPNKKKFSILFGTEEGIGAGIAGLGQMLQRYTDSNAVIYIAYASNEPITGPFKPKQEINLKSFTLEQFETAYSNLIICVGIDMLQKLKSPISTEHRGIFKNPFNEIRGTYRNIAMKLHGWAGTVEKQFFNKKYMTVFPTPHAGRLLHNSIKKGGLYLGTDKQPFSYNTYYETNEEPPSIKGKFSPIKQELIGDTPTNSTGIMEDLHVFELDALSNYYTDTE